MVGKQEVSEGVLGDIPELDPVVVSCVGAGEVTDDGTSGGGGEGVGGRDITWVAVRNIVGEDGTGADRKNTCGKNGCKCRQRETQW